MFNFQTRSYWEGIKNAILGVDFIPREWDIFNADETIITIVKKVVPRVLEQCHEDNIWYKDMVRLGELVEILGGDFKYEEPEIYDKQCKEFGELLGKLFFHLWI